MEINDFYKQDFFTTAVVEYIGGQERLIAVFRLQQDADLFFELLKKKYEEIYKVRFKQISLFER